MEAQGGEKWGEVDFMGCMHAVGYMKGMDNGELLERKKRPQVNGYIERVGLVN
jgi:hypothetical protein